MELGHLGNTVVRYVQYSFLVRNKTKLGAVIVRYAIQCAPAFLDLSVLVPVISKIVRVVHVSSGLKTKLGTRTARYTTRPCFSWIFPHLFQW